MSITTLDISLTIIHGMMNGLTARGGVISTLFYAANNLNWIFTSPHSDKVIQIRHTNTSIGYMQNMPLIFIGDAFDGVDSVTNRQTLSGATYLGTYGKVGSVTLVLTDNVIHFNFNMAGTVAVAGTFTLAKLTNSTKVAFVTCEAHESVSMGAEGINTTTGLTARPFKWGLGEWISVQGNYFAMDFLVGANGRAIGTIARAKMLASPIVLHRAFL